MDENPINENRQKENPWIVARMLAGLLALAVILTVVPLYCDGVKNVREAAERNEQKQRLYKLFEGLCTFYDANQKLFPSDLAQLAPHLDANLADRIRKGEIEVIWNAAPFGEQAGGSYQKLIAWYSKANANGYRQVLYLDGSVDMLFEYDFRNAAKAQTVPEIQKGK